MPSQVIMPEKKKDVGKEMFMDMAKEGISAYAKSKFSGPSEETKPSGPSDTSGTALNTSATTTQSMTENNPRERRMNSYQRYT